jgi:signal transduction histidine kinase/ligand-binding sensor domain-containing protein
MSVRAPATFSRVQGIFLGRRSSGLAVSPLEKRDAVPAPKADSANIPGRGFLCLLLFLFAMNWAWAVDPHRLISQYGHTAWRSQDGFVSHGATITQTTDGYIWIADATGLMQFDGVTFTPWVPREGQQLPSGSSSLLGARDGSLWIGAPGGLAQLKNGELFNYASQIGGAGISQIIEDHAGTIWFTRYRVGDGKGPLCRVTDRQVQCYGEKDGISVKYGLGLAEDTTGNIWFGSSALCRWASGSTNLYFEQELKHTAGYGAVAVVADQSGSIWTGLDGTGPNLGVRYYSNGKWSSYMIPGFDGRTIRSQAMLVDRNHSLWIGTESMGLYHVHDGIADHYSNAEGLSGNQVASIYEDKEGNLWVATDRGVDLFRDTAVVTFSTNEGLIGANVHSILALSNGSVWVGNAGALDVIHAGGISAIAAGQGLPGHDVAAMFEDSTGRIWLGIDNTVMTYKLGRFVEIKKADGSLLRQAGYASALAIDADAKGNIWVLTTKADQRYLLRIRDQRPQDDFRVDINRAQFLAVDRTAEIWIASEDGKLARYRNGKVEAVVSLRSGESRVVPRSLYIDSDNALNAATSNGLYRLKDGHLSLMDSRNGLPCSSIFSTIEDNYGSLWLYAKCGLLRISASDWATWQKFPDRKVPVKTFDALDGAQPDLSQNQPVVSKSPDGRLWFASGEFVQMVDPSQTYANLIPPPVRIEKLVADRDSYDTSTQLSLPPLRRELEINYTALSFKVPRKVYFRYKLEGHDKDWQEAGSRRQAFYSDLRPGRYRFRVIACNNDGVWNEAGDTLDFLVTPDWFQTSWFRILCILSGVFIVWVIYRLRVLQISRAISARFDERLAERTRMARDLHDTFLQTVQGSKLVADRALKPSTDVRRMRQAMEQLSVWLGQATEEGRAALNSLRTTTTQTNDLAEALRRVTENGLIPSSMVTFSVVGDAREMHPIVRDEIYRIGYEAIRNAFAHSSASRMEVELRYADDLVLRVSDSGTGIDPDIAETGKDGHFGLQGMRERAARIGGKLTIVSSTNLGTEIRLIVPGSIIFRKMILRRSLFTRIRNVFR